MSHLYYICSFPRKAPDDRSAALRPPGGFARRPRSASPAHLRSPAGGRELQGHRGGGRPVARAAEADRAGGDGARKGPADHKRMQFARLEPALRLAARSVAEGDAKAIPLLIKLVDRLERYSEAPAPAPRRRAAGRPAGGANSVNRGR